MAAILCNGLVNLCEGICLNCGKICTVPCRFLSSACKPLCDATATLCSSPFCIYVTVALLFNVPPIAVGFMALPNASNGCQASIWLLANVPLCIINIMAAWYIAVRIQNRDDPQLQDKRTSLSRASYLLCYDPWVAVYILILTGFFVWLCIGLSWKATGEINANGSCEDNVLDLVNSSIGCGFSFLSVGFSALCVSLCVAWCDGRDYQDDTATNQGGNGYQNIAVGNNRIQGANVQNQQQHGYDAPYTATMNRNDVEAPVAVAVAVATPVDNSISNSTYHSPAPLPAPSAPPRRDSFEDEVSAAAFGTAVGSKIGKLFNVDEKKKSEFETSGAKASMAVNSGISAAKKFLKIGKSSK